MTGGEKRFFDSWGIARKKWKWGENFKRTALYFVLPFVLLIDTINFFIIGDAKYAYMSFGHLWDLITNFIGFSLFIGFTYNLFTWNINEMRYWELVRKSKKEDET
ncbi:MAG TPA: hypothetical protein VNI52_01990 [Sphingobacteriaceae bacterium]|nr:hypothetical protein [Sphingobacteriaceae bacterium]